MRGNGDISGVHTPVVVEEPTPRPRSGKAWGAAGTAFTIFAGVCVFVWFLAQGLVVTQKEYRADQKAQEEVGKKAAEDKGALNATLGQINITLGELKADVKTIKDSMPATRRPR